MGERFKGQLATSSGAKGLETIQLKHVSSEYIKELKKSISRVPFKCDYEIRFRFPGIMFNVKDGNHRRGFIKNGQGNIKIIQNPIKDISPNQRYNPKVVTYIEERLPFLTKTIDGFDKTIETANISLLNRNWSMPTKLNFSDLTITFYDMYVQHADGKYEWVSVSELFKVWIDNIFRCEVGSNNNIDSYHTVLNYFHDYAIPQMDILQFTRRLEFGDAKNYGHSENRLDGQISYFDNKFKQGLWDSYLQETNQYLAKELNDMQKQKLRGNSVAEKTIGLIDDIMTPIVNLIYTTAGIQNFVQKYTNKEESIKDLRKEMQESLTYSYNEFYNEYAKIAESYSGNGERTLKPFYDKTNPPPPDGILPGGAEPPNDLYGQELQSLIEGMQILDENKIKTIQKEAFTKYQNKAKDDGIPALLTSPNLTKAIEWLAFASSAWSSYDLAKMLIGHLPVAVGNIGRITDKDWHDGFDSGKGGVFQKPSAGDRAKAMAGDILPGNLLTTEFKDDSAQSIISYLRSLEYAYIQEKHVNPGWQDIFKLPLNKQAYKELERDGRFKNAKIMDIEQSQDPWGQDSESGINIIPIKTFRFYDLYPVSISFDNLDFDDDETLTTFSVTFKYTHFEQK